MNRGEKGKADGLGDLLPSAEGIEIFRERMLEHLTDLRRHPPLPEDVRRLIVRRNACTVLLPALVGALRAYGYTDRLDTLSDAGHALESYEHARVYDAHGIALADAVFVAMTFIDPHWHMDNPSEYLWRLCYRLGQLATLERDARRDADRRKTAKATAAKTAGGWEKQETMAYAVRHVRQGNGRLKSKAALSREIYRHLWERSQQGAGRFTRPMLGMGEDGYPIHTEAALRTIQGWFEAQYDAQS